MRRFHAARVLPSPIKGVYSTHIESDHHFGRHWHEAYGFGFLESGAQNWWSGRGHVCGYPGEVITTNPGEVHDGRPHGAATRRWRIVYMDVDAMASVTAQDDHHAEIVLPVIRDAALMHAVRRLFSRLERWHVHGAASGNGAHALAFEEALVESCVRLMARHGSKPVTTDVPRSDLRRVRERLADDLAPPASLAELAALSGLSRFKVLRRFKQAFGLPPHAWLLRHRAERARVLIAAGSALAATAAACGFVDQSHMTRIFVRQFGFTPGAWRKAMLQ